MDQVAQVREKIDIVALINEFVPLKKAGRNFTASCPFHNEKTPSFVVSSERQMWHCFGCQKGGDAYTFLMEYEHIEFPEALRILAHRAGIELAFSRFETGIASKKEKIYAINRLACEFYHYVLTKHTAGKHALSYVAERGITPEVTATFQLGFAPSGGSLSSYLLKKKGYSKDEIIEAGLATRRGTSLADFFQDRLVFPLFDHRSSVVGFSGRALSATAPAKYINTRETLAYQKGSHFFGLHIAKDAIKKEEKAILMEGEFDVLSSFQEGVPNVIAVKGTALTEAQVQLISRFCTKVLLCFDKDRAGKEAMKRSIPLLEKKGISIDVVDYDGKDPDEAIKKDPYAFKKAVKQSVGVYDYLLADAIAASDPRSAEGKRQISEELLPYFVAIENEIVKEHYLRKLSTVLDVSFEGILKQAEKIGQKERKTSVATLATRSGREKQTREQMLEEYLLSLMVQSENAKDITLEVASVLKDFSFQNEACRKILTSLVAFVADKETFASKEFLLKLPTELLPAFDRCFLFPLPKLADGVTYKDEAIKVAKELRVVYLRTQIAALSKQLKGHEDNEELVALQEEFTKLVGQLKGSS